MRNYDYNQLFAAPAEARKEGKVATTGYNDSWFVDLIDLHKRTPREISLVHVTVLVRWHHAHPATHFASLRQGVSVLGPVGKRVSSNLRNAADQLTGRPFAH